MTTFDQSSSQSAGPPDHRAEPRGGTIPWGPAWIGAAVALPVYVVLQLLFIALGWMALGVDGAGAGVAASVVSALLAVFALFVGGLAGGTASAAVRDSARTALQGAMTWALTAVGLLGLGLFGGGAIAGTLGGLTQLVIVTGPQQFAGNPAVVAQALQAVQNGAGWAVLWLGVAFVAAVVGTGAGAAASISTDDVARERTDDRRAR